MQLVGATRAARVCLLDMRAKFETLDRHFMRYMRLTCARAIVCRAFGSFWAPNLHSVVSPFQPRDPLCLINQHDQQGPPCPYMHTHAHILHSCTHCRPL